MKPLLIPERYRKARCGYYVRCGHCRKNVTTKCGDSKKKIHTCKHTENHRFQSKVVVPGSSATKKQMKVKTWGAEVRDLQEFFMLHRAFVDSIDFIPEPDIKPRPIFLTDCIAWYIDWLADEDVPSYERKNNSIKYLENQSVNFRHMKDALKEKGVSVDRLEVTRFDKRYVDIIHEYLASKFANKTVNDKVASYRALFKFLIAEGYDVNNIWLKVRQKPTKANTNIISMSEFEKLCDSVKPELGIKIENKGGGRKGKKNLYRDYLVSAWKLSLFSGCRPEELINIRVKDVKENHIIGINYKVSRAKKIEVSRLIPLFSELETHVVNLIKIQSLQESDYLIAPNEENREAIRRVISNAFSHYWNQVFPTPRRLYDLRNTYATAILPIAGKELSGRIGLHKNLATTIEHYINEEKVLDDLKGRQLFG